jgi:hypothetical protein
MRRQVKGGSTLIEVLIASGLFLLSLLLCGELSVVGMHSETSTTDKNQAFRWGTTALDELNRDLAHTTEIYQPSLGYAKGQSPVHLITTIPLVLRSSSASLGPTVVGYALDSSKGTLTRTPYNPAYDPASPGSLVLLSGQQPKVVASWVTDFSIYGVDATTEYGAKMVVTQLTVSTVAPGNTGPSLSLQSLTRLREL